MNILEKIPDVEVKFQPLLKPSYIVLLAHDAGGQGPGIEPHSIISLPVCSPSLSNRTAFPLHAVWHFFQYVGKRAALFILLH